MNDITSGFCPKCTTGTFKNLPYSEAMCDKCGIILKNDGNRAMQAPPPDRMEYGPRPGGNRYAI